MLARLRTCESLGKKGPQRRGVGRKFTGRKVPHVGTMRMWARNPPIPLNSALGNPNKAAFFEHLARNRIWLLPDVLWPEEGFNGDGAVVSYLDDKGDNDEPYSNSISSVRVIQ